MILIANKFIKIFLYFVFFIFNIKFKKKKILHTVHLFIHIQLAHVGMQITDYDYSVTNMQAVTHCHCGLVVREFYMTGCRLDPCAQQSYMKL